MNLGKAPKRIDDNIAVWSEMGELGAKYKCLSLGVGVPGYRAPDFLKEAMIEAVTENHNDYCRGFGHPLLVKAIADQYSKPFQRKLDPMKEVMVTPGAIGALACFIMALVNKGDELVCFEPAFPRYFEDTMIANGTLKTIPLEANSDGEWFFTEEKLR